MNQNSRPPLSSAHLSQQWQLIKARVPRSTFITHSMGNYHDPYQRLRKNVCELYMCGRKGMCEQVQVFIDYILFYLVIFVFVYFLLYYIFLCARGLFVCRVVLVLV